MQVTQQGRTAKISAPFLYVFVFQPGRNKKPRWGTKSASLNKELNKWFHIFHRLIKIVYKTTFQNSVFKSNSSLVIFFKNFVCFIKSTNVFRDTHTHFLTQVGKTLSCWVGSRIPEKPHWKRSFWGILLACCLNANWCPHHF